MIGRCKNTFSILTKAKDMLKRNNSLLLVIIAGLFMMIACKKDKTDPIPYAYVNFVIYPNSTVWLELNTIGGYAYVNADPPSKGVIIYRSDVDEFTALERTCPHNPYDNCASGPVKVEHGGSVAIDSCCMSRFLLLDGSVVQGPSAYPLRVYHTTYDGNALRVYN